MLCHANAPTLTRCNFLKHIPKFIIFGIHNLQTFKQKHLSMNYCYCSITYLIFLLNCIIDSRENYMSHSLTFTVNRRNRHTLFSVYNLVVVNQPDKYCSSPPNCCTIDMPYTRGNAGPKFNHFQVKTV